MNLTLVDVQCDAIVDDSMGALGHRHIYRCSRDWTQVRVTKKGHAHVCTQHAKAKRVKVVAQPTLRKRLHTDPIPRHGCDACERKAAAA